MVEWNNIEQKDIEILDSPAQNDKVLILYGKKLTILLNTVEHRPWQPPQLHDDNDRRCSMIGRVTFFKRKCAEINWQTIKYRLDS
jgi:hypothetical protein